MAEMKPKNIYKVKTTVHLTDEITAVEMVSPGEFGGRLSCHKIDIPANAEYPVHDHPSEHIILVLEGTGWMKYWKNKREHGFDLKAGDVFFVPANAPHQVGAYDNGAIMLAMSSDSKPLTDPNRLRVVKK